MAHAAVPKVEKRVLVSYAYYDARDSSRANLEFFLKVGILRHRPSSMVTYGFVINGFDCSVPLPTERRDVVVLRRENVGFDYGQHLALLLHLAGVRAMHKSRLLDRLNYTHFFFMNCGVRGPFLPTYWPMEAHWANTYLDLLDAKVKIVGASIACLDKSDYCVVHDPGCYGPKVEGYMWATDRVGLGTLLDHGPNKVFKQHASKVEAVLHGEYGMNRAIFAANYSIATPLLAYRGVDWSDFRRLNSETCNGFVHPSREGSYYGISVHPLETVFIKTSWSGLPRVRP